VTYLLSSGRLIDRSKQYSDTRLWFTDAAYNFAWSGTFTRDPHYTIKGETTSSGDTNVVFHHKTHYKSGIWQGEVTMPCAKAPKQQALF
jgi:hypothetical protein